MARLGDHPHVVTVYDAVEDGGALHIVARYMAGGSLAERLAAAPGGRLDVAEVLRTGRALADALAHAHEHGVVHRDVKPDNVWLAADGDAGLGDFGIAVAAGDPAAGGGAATGTPYYQAPEQAEGGARRCRSPTSTRSARRCGSCCAAGPPFTGADAAALLAQHRNAVPEPPSRHAPGVPPDARRARARACSPSARRTARSGPPRCATRSTGSAARRASRSPPWPPTASRSSAATRSWPACARRCDRAIGGSAHVVAVGRGAGDRQDADRRRGGGRGAAPGARRSSAGAPARSRAPTARGAARCARSWRRRPGSRRPVLDELRRLTGDGRVPELAAGAPGGEEARLRMFDAVVELVRASAARARAVHRAGGRPRRRPLVARAARAPAARRARRAAAARAHLPRAPRCRRAIRSPPSWRRSTATAG